MQPRRTHQAVAEAERPLMGCVVLLALAVVVAAVLAFFLGGLDLDSFAWRGATPPIPEADRLVRIEFAAEPAEELVGEWLAGQVVLEPVVLWQPGTASLGYGDSVVGEFEGAAVSRGFFEAVVVQPSLGRSLMEQDERGSL